MYIKKTYFTFGYLGFIDSPPSYQGRNSREISGGDGHPGNSIANNFNPYPSTFIQLPPQPPPSMNCNINKGIGKSANNSIRAIYSGRFDFQYPC